MSDNGETVLGVGSFGLDLELSGRFIDPMSVRVCQVVEMDEFKESACFFIFSFRYRLRVAEFNGQHDVRQAIDLTDTFTPGPGAVVLLEGRLKETISTISLCEE